MKRLRKTVALLLALLCLAPLGAAARADAVRSCVVLGADLSDEQIESIYESFGVSRGSVAEYVITNAEERAALAGHVSEDFLGTKSLSCVYLELLDEGAGLDVSTKNISYCTAEMYMSALATAGITDAKLIVAAPFEVSGTAALAGIYKAYEEITGSRLDEQAMQVGTQELTTTGELAEEIGEESSAIVNDLKLTLDELRKMSDGELRAAIVTIADKYGVKLTETQIDQLSSLCRTLGKLDVDELKGRVEKIQDTMQKVSEAKTKVVGFMQTLKKIGASIKDFFAWIGNLLKK